MASPTSIPQLENMLQLADINSQGLVEWGGINGLENILAQTLATLGYRGAMYFETQGQMSLAGASDGWFACCPDSTGVLNIYRFFPVIDNTIIGGIISSSAGQWRPIMSVSTSSGPWKLNNDGDIVPNIGNENAGVGIGQTTVPADLWLAMPPINSGGTAMGVLLPTMTNTQMNSMITPTNWMVIVNSQTGMALKQHPSVGFKSIGVLKGTVTAGSISGTTFTVPIGFTQFATDYMIKLTASDNFTATALKNGWYIAVSDKTATQYIITFQVSQSGQLNFDWELSH